MSRHLGVPSDDSGAMRAQRSRPDHWRRRLHAWRGDIVSDCPTLDRYAPFDQSRPAAFRPARHRPLQACHFSQTVFLALNMPHQLELVPLGRADEVDVYLTHSKAHHGGAWSVNHMNAAPGPENYLPEVPSLIFLAH
ncbi:hypothetical protein FAGKG844_140066 [Frankia sp. AgKG'84/4]